MNTKPSPFRYSMDYESTLGDRYARHRIFLDLAGKGGRVLELGCNDGFLSRHLSERGCRVTGIELNPEAGESARKWCDNVLICDLNNMDWAARLEGLYDVVMCGDVLEHLIEPSRALRMIADILKPDGRLVISLPNIAHWSIRADLLLGKFEYEPTGILDATHLRFFTLRSARRILDEAGYIVTQFFPIIGGCCTGHFRPGWQFAAKCWPGLFAYQLIFTATLASGRQHQIQSANK